MLAAGAAGVGVREFVDRNAEAFLALGGALSLTVDDFIRTSRDPRHRPGVEAFWRVCSADLYRQRYTGLYCTGCEQFYAPAELSDGRCPEHETEPELVNEENWFFRLSRYAAPLREAIIRAAADRARRAPQRGARVHRRRSCGLLGVTAGDRAAGGPGASPCSVTRAR